MKLYCLLCAASLVLPTSLLAQGRETRTAESATDVLASFSGIPERAIPPSLLRDAQGVAIIPGLIKAGLLIGGRHGRGLVMLREPDGSWSNPVFVSLTGGSVGWQIGVQSIDVVLVFKTRANLERIIKGKGKLTLGVDAAIAAGPVGRQAEAGTDGMLKAEIYSYSRSRGLFVGVSLEGAALLADPEANEAFYHVRGGYPADILAFRGPVPVTVHKLRVELAKMAGVPMAPVEFQPPPLAAPVPAPRPVPVPPAVPPPAVPPPAVPPPAVPLPPQPK